MGGVRWWLGVWALLVLFFSTRTEVRGGPVIWDAVNWVEAFKISLALWTSWGCLALIIVWIDRRLPIPEGALFQRLLVHLPLSLIFTVAAAYLNHIFLILVDAPPVTVVSGGFLATAWRAIHRIGVFFYWVIVGSYILVNHQASIKDRQLRTAALEKLLSDARLNLLRAQLQPHFLFNALNTVSALVEENPQAARLMLEQIGELLRLSLKHIDQQQIPVEQELAFVERYLRLERMRFQDRLAVSMNIDPNVCGALVPPFILQPLVENAVRHGAAARPAGGRVAIDAWRANGAVHLQVRDNGPGFSIGWSSTRSTGVGLANTRERLRHLYGESNQSLVVSEEPEGGVRVDLCVPCRFGVAKAVEVT